MARVSYALAVVGISLAAFLTSLDFAVVNAALPAIQKHLNMSIHHLQWVMNIYVIVIAITLVAQGRLGDIVGHKKMLIIGTSVFTVASLLCAVSPTGAVLILGRGLQGLSSAIITPCSLALITSITPSNSRGKAIGVWTSVSGIGFASGPIVGGLLTTWIGWRSIFYINIPFGIISLLLFMPLVGETKKRKEKVDVLGFLTLGIAIASFTLLLVEGEAVGWDWWFVFLMLVISFLALLVFYFHEKRTLFPMLQLNLLRHPSFLMGMFANVSMLLYAYVAFFLIPLFLAHVRGDNAAQIGLRLLPITLAMVVVSPLVGFWVDKSSFKPALRFGLALLALSAFLQIIFYWWSPLWFIVLAFICMGIAWGCVFGTATVAAIDALPAEESGQASGALWTLQNIGGTVGLSLTALMFSIFPSHSFMFKFSINMLLVFCLILMALGFVARLSRKIL